MHSPLTESKHALENSLKNLKAQGEEIVVNEQRLAASKEEEGRLLADQWDDESQQVERINREGARQKLLSAKIEQGAAAVDRLKAELADRVRDAHNQFSNALGALQSRRQEKHLETLKAIVADDKRWPYAEETAKLFIRFAADVSRIDVLGDHAQNMLRSGAVSAAAGLLLDDIAVLEKELAK